MNEARSQSIPAIDWWITSRCSLSCDFCYGPRPGSDPGHLRERIADVISESSARTVTFCGGEPLLVKEISRLASQQADSAKTTILNTNGEFLKRRFFRDGLLREPFPFDVVGLSIDGPTSEVHKEMRGAKARLDLALSAAELIRTSGAAKLKIATVISSVNADSLAALARMIREMRPAIWRVYQYSPWGPVNTGQHRHQISAGAFWQTVQELQALAAPTPVAPSGTEHTSGCAIVDPSGDVLLPTSLGYTILGNCLEEPLDDVWERHPRRESIEENKSWQVAVAQTMTGKGRTL